MITRKSGTYALILQSKKLSPLTVGKLGQIQVVPGCYVYVGSAFGPGGLGARLSHHHRKTDTPHWHMDYLRPRVDIVEIWYTTDPRRHEHQWAKTLAAHSRASMPVPGFGATDCSCRTHLFFFKARPSHIYFRKSVRSQCPDHGTVHFCIPPACGAGI